MANDYRTPGVYVEEIPKFPPSVAGVATAIPAFVGYTENAADEIKNIPCRISNLLEYEALFGQGPKLSVKADKTIENAMYVLYDSIRLFYDNGGSVCYIVSVGQYGKEVPDALIASNFQTGINAVEKIDEVTLLLFPDAVGLADASTLAGIQNLALKQCRKLGDRFAILDVQKGNTSDDIQAFRNSISNDAMELRYGAAYYPYLSTIYTKPWSFKDVKTYCDNFADVADLMDTDAKANLTKVLTINFDVPLTDTDQLSINSIIPFIPGYNEALKALNAKTTIIPPSGSIAGIYAATDQYRGVWKAPANVSITSLNGVSDFITHEDQEKMNVDSANGKSVNAIRVFSGKGILVWGARTLDGNSSEWRYVPVRRLFNYIEESIKKSTSWAVFSPNDGNTWIKIKSQIENFLSNLWRTGALAGSTPEKSYFVDVGLGVTMSDTDIKDGLLIVEIGLAAVRPAEFIILKFSHKIQE